MSVVPDTAELVEPVMPIAIDTISVSERCDRCGSQAFVRASILVRDSGIMVDLVFCAHHFHAYEAKLRLIAIAVQDESGRLNPKST